MNYITNHGEGVWNTLARSAGLKRTGKSCRLRWLNYLRPDVRRGNITPEEQLLIIELHSRWGNRWSKIARQLPGRTDNEIKNYWRTRIQKKIKDDHHFDYQQTAPAFEGSTGDQVMSVEDSGIGKSSPVCNTINNDLGSLLVGTPSGEPNDGFWTLEDFWSMQMFSSDPIN
ncbi:unnamed protein product [Spirodela intermedia]|nr:unnamed protein product [Spirodela intermedia]CAA6665553.1 unnamed protein product [Spirodela intermedia]